MLQTMDAKDVGLSDAAEPVRSETVTVTARPPVCDIAADDQERTPGETLRKGAFHGLPEGRPRRKEYRGAEMDVFDRQFLQDLNKFSAGVPVSTLVRALAATSALVTPQQAAPVEQSKHETTPRDSHDLRHRARPVVHEAQCRHRDDLIEGLVRKRQVASVPFHVGYIVARPLAGEIERVGIDVQSGHVKACDSKATGEPTGTATHVEQAFAGRRIEMTT